MTYGDLDTISKKIQNRCGLEAPTKHTFFRDEEGKIYIKFWFDSLKLPDYLQDEEEKLTDGEHKGITNTFSNNAAYTHEDDFEIVEFNTNEGWVKVLPDDQKFKITESRLKEAEEDPDTGVMKPTHALIYWPSQFVGAGSPEIKEASLKFFTDAVAYYKDKYKNKDMVVKFIISSTKESNKLLQATMVSHLKDTLDLNDEDLDVFTLAGTAGPEKILSQGVDKNNSIVVEIPGVDYLKINTGDVKTENAPNELVEEVNHILQLEEALLKEITESYSKNVLEPYIKNKLNARYEEWDKEYNKKHSNTTEVDNTQNNNQEGNQNNNQEGSQNNNQGNTSGQPPAQNESYKKNLLYRVYKLKEEAQGNPAPQENTQGNETQTQQTQTKQVKINKSDENSADHYKQYEKARDWYTANLETGDSVLFTGVSDAIICNCPSKSEIAEELAKAKDWEEKVGIELTNKLKSFAYATVGEAYNALQQEAVIPAAKKVVNSLKLTMQKSIETQGNGQDNDLQFKVTTETDKLGPQDSKVGADVGILNIVYTSLFNEARETLNKIKKSFNLRIEGFNVN